MGAAKKAAPKKKSVKKAIKKATKKKAAPKKSKASKKSGKTRKGRKSDATRAAGKQRALAMKKLGLGIFAPKKLSKDLAAICGKDTLPRTQVTKKVWDYIKKKGLNKGRDISPDA